MHKNQHAQGGLSHGKTSPRHFGGRRPAGQDRAPRIRNAARTRHSGPRLCPQDRRTLRPAARARRRNLRRRLSRRPLGAARGAGHLGGLFCLSGAGRLARRHRGDGGRRARGRHLPSGQSGDAAILRGRPHPADAAELFVRTGVRMGWDRRRACQGHGVLRKSRRAGPPQQGAVRLPWGREQTMLPLVAAEDVARVAVGLLTGPALTAGTAYPVVGSVISLQDIIATFGRVLAKNVRYEEITDDEWRRAALARDVNAHALEHLSALWKALRTAGLDPQRARFAVTDTIERLGGAHPNTFEAFVREGHGELLAKSA